MEPSLIGTLQQCPTPHGEPAPLSPEAFGAGVEGCRSTLLLIAAAEVGRSDAPDVVQDACVLAYQRLARFEPGTNLAAWLAAFVRGAARNHSKKRRRTLLRLRRVAEGQTSIAEDAASMPKAELAQEIDATLSTLTTDQRTCLVLKTVQGLSYREIATVLSIGEATARSHVFRARATLHARCGQEGAAP